MAFAPWARFYGDEAASPNQYVKKPLMLAMGASLSWTVVDTGEPEAAAVEAGACMFGNVRLHRPSL